LSDAKPLRLCKELMEFVQIRYAFLSLTLDEEKNPVHSLDFGSENNAKSMKVIRKYLAVVYMKALPVEY
jgi:hypothetical protein